MSFSADVSKYKCLLMFMSLFKISPLDTNGWRPVFEELMNDIRVKYSYNNKGGAILVDKRSLINTLCFRELCCFTAHFIKDCSLLINIYL